jgi:CBS domain containing-hemolysin-like protein
VNLPIWISIFSLAAAGFASVGARSLRRFSRAKLEELCREERTVPLYSQIVQRRERTIAAADSLLALATAIAVAAGIDWASASEAFSSDPAWIGAFGGVILGVVLLWATTVWIPIGVARLWADPFVLRTWSFWHGAAVALAPSVLPAHGISRLLQRFSGREPAQREGLMEEDAREMIEGVIELGDVDVADVMTPRTDMVALHIELPWDDAVRAVCQSGHTRLPVYKKSPDDIVGILHTKDLLVEMAKPDDDSRLGWPQLLRKPFFVPETKPVDDLLQEFQRSRNHIAVVLDEFGGVSGIVTIEDVLEEIVGEIADEHDEVPGGGIKSIDECSAEALAKVRIHEINERLGLSLPEDEDFDTIGGFVFHELGRIPNVGEELVWQDVRIKVLEATRRRIDRVSIRVMNKSQPAA